MEIFDQEQNKYRKDAPRDPNGEEHHATFFHRSDMNDWTPLWEKLCFFLIGFLGFQVFGFFFSSLMMNTRYYNPDANSFTARGNNIVNLVCYAVLFIGFLLFLFLDKRKTYKRVFEGFRDPKTYLYALVGFFLILIVDIGLGTLFENFVPNYASNENQSSLELMVKDSWAMAMFPIIFFAPFCEELTYRVGLLDTTGHKNRILGIVLSALLFGLIHFGYDKVLLMMTATTDEVYLAAKADVIIELVNLPVYILSGAILGTVYAASGKISASMTTHIAVNTLSFISILLKIAAEANGTLEPVSSLMRFFLR